MDRQEIFEKVKEIVSPFVDVPNPQKAEIKGSDSLKLDLECDSLDGVEISMELDKTFGIHTDDEDIATINNGTVDDIVDMVERKLTKKGGKQS